MSEQENLSFENKFILDWLKENTQVRKKILYRFDLAFVCIYVC